MDDDDNKVMSFENAKFRKSGEEIAAKFEEMLSGHLHFHASQALKAK